MNKYISRYSNGKEVSAAQYITELICEHKALLSKEDLHYKFWEHKKWAQFFRNQIASANKLVKKYDAKAIINALLGVKGQKIYSLRAPHLIPMIEQEQKKLDQQANTPHVSIERKTNVSFGRSTNNTKNIFSKLKDIE